MICKLRLVQFHASILASAVSIVSETLEMEAQHALHLCTMSHAIAFKTVDVLT